MRHRHLSKYFQRSADRSEHMEKKSLGLKLEHELFGLNRKIFGFNVFPILVGVFREKKMELGIILKLEKQRIEKELRGQSSFYCQNEFALLF